MSTPETPGARRPFRPVWRVALAACGLCWSVLSFGADPAAALRDRYGDLAEQLKRNPFHRPLYLESSEANSSVKGDIYAVMDYPYAVVSGKLDDPVQGPANWCAVLILHLNVKYCRASAAGDDAVLDVNIGRKVDQKLSDTYRVAFRYRAQPATPGYFQVGLNADSGPMSTKDYRISLEAVPLGDTRTFLHLTYSYGFGTLGRVAMKTYLATVGRDKVGFTTVGAPAGTPPDYIGGVRGLLERNTMRYYLAIDAYLGTLDKPLDQRLARWFDATEQYARQLHEMDRQDYLQMKAKEVQRQQAAR
ncbi:hypothetical protein WS63_32700 [Burkholderia stagnalis]|uniref:hypothetical protein n=1 Tax=Burkholderia stagnalis TaxID=1503054 RepID=UPI000758DE2B|nr:hypothetical protein [Burkholderia stagnalis]KVD96332.1 hypothetical protein WS63_32700 [Burkholderia stagnalis]KWK17435.1 hypothetical protein WT77_28380 [Burkholderia stagnalis]KWK51090.1 hypothetical protein WT80_13200 [Burkholderia stagnalis]KWK52223.1 hypothetical protein WT81_27030 [Burkholderia stagnalis]KWN66580.1 hypothetical protein WT90_29500 [Burkholderia stagnalis]